MPSLEKIHGAEAKFLEEIFERTMSYASSLSTTSRPVSESLLPGILNAYDGLLNETETTWKKATQTDVEAFKQKTDLLRPGTMIDLVRRTDIPRSDVRNFDLMNINFNLLGLGGNDMKLKTVEMFKRVAGEDIAENMIPKFVDEVYSGYKINPYHNFSHGFSVCQVFFYMWHMSPGLQKMADQIDLFAGCVGSLCHDIGHRSFKVSPSWTE